MADHVYSVLCQEVLFEEGTKLASIIRVMERVNVTNREEFEKDNPPRIPHPMKIFSWFVRSDYDVGEPPITVRYNLTAPDGSKERIGLLELDLKESTGAHGLVGIRTFPNKGFGVYWFDISFSRGGKKWKRATRLPMQFWPIEHKEVD